jgi:hypothetical protein
MPQRFRFLSGSVLFLLLLTGSLAPAAARPLRSAVELRTAAISTWDRFFAWWEVARDLARVTTGSVFPYGTDDPLSSLDSKTDNGSGIDPFGRPTTSQDVGSGIDPFGGK